MNHNLTISEEDRQATIMALANLAHHCPGWDDMLKRIAAKIDDADCSMYEGFKETAPAGARVPDSLPSIAMAAAKMLEEHNAQLKTDVQTLVSYARTTQGFWDADRDMRVGKRLLAMGGDLAGYSPKLDELHLRHQHNARP